MDNRRIFLDRYRELGEDIDPKIRLRRSLRVNTLKITVSALIERLQEKGIMLEKIPFVRDGYYYTSPFSLGATPEYLLGYYYLQEAASQIPVEHLELSPSEMVLDMAASPGSKTTQIAQWMDNKGILVAMDLKKERIGSLRNNIERMGVTNSVIYHLDGRKAESLGMMFDRILLDAPCSGNYAAEKNFFSLKQPGGNAPLVKTQKQLLEAAYAVLKRKGKLVYSTCTLEPEENEAVIDGFLNAYPDMRLEPLRLLIGDPGMTEVFGQGLSPELAKAKRLWPHKSGTQGFFIAKLVKA